MLPKVVEERKQILYLLGPVGGGKSSLAERLKQLMEHRPIYTLKAGNQISPIFESPAGPFPPGARMCAGCSKINMELPVDASTA